MESLKIWTPHQTNFHVALWFQDQIVESFEW
jgi:hypothetical protein